MTEKVPSHRLSQADMDAVQYEGFIDAIEDGRIFGWAFNPENLSEPVKIDIYHVEEFLGTISADRYREDLIEYSGDSGKHAFVFTLPKNLWSEPNENFHACFEGTTVPLLRGKRASVLPEPPIPGAKNSDVAAETKTERSQEELDKINSLVGRVETIERLSVGLLGVIDPQSEHQIRNAKTMEEAAARIELTEETVGDIESFVVRIDKQIKEVENAQKMINEKQQPAWYENPAKISLLISILTLGIVLSSFVLNS